MSNLLRIALVAEGPTDRIVIEAALNSILSRRKSYILTQLQPEGSLVFGSLGTGWSGVYKWCKQRPQGRLSLDGLLYQNFDILILHLDADVADNNYSAGSITPDGRDAALPCSRPCPPPSDTTDPLRMVLLSWCGEQNLRANTVICMPSKSMEAWVLAALFPNDSAIRRGRDIECYPNPESRLAQQPKPVRIRKTQRDYQGHSHKLETAWPNLVGKMAISEAGRFQQDILNLIL